MAPNARSMKVAVLGLTILILVGCGANMPTRYYVLTPMNKTNPSPAIADGPKISVGVGPVEIPEYLDRPQLIRHSAGNELQLSELEQWAEPLESNIPAVLAENLSSLLGTDEINLYPWSSSTNVDYQVRLEVNRFARRSTGETVVSARWHLIDPDTDKVLMTRKFHFTDPTGPGDSGAAVRAKSRALARLSQDIAAELAHLSGASLANRARLSTDPEIAMVGGL